jgi:hypothetical protein
MGATRGFCAKSLGRESVSVCFLEFWSGHEGKFLRMHCLELVEDLTRFSQFYYYATSAMVSVSTCDDLIAIYPAFATGVLSWKQFGGCTPAQLDKLCAMWFPGGENSEKSSALMKCVWKRHPSQLAKRKATAENFFNGGLMLCLFADFPFVSTGLIWRPYVAYKVPVTLQANGKLVQTISDWISGYEFDIVISSAVACSLGLDVAVPAASVPCCVSQGAPTTLYAKHDGIIKIVFITGRGRIRSTKSVDAFIGGDCSFIGAFTMRRLGLSLLDTTGIICVHPQRPVRTRKHREA